MKMMLGRKSVKICCKLLGGGRRNAGRWRGRKSFGSLAQNSTDRLNLAVCYRILDEWQDFQEGKILNHLSVRTKSSDTEYPQDVLLLIPEGMLWKEVTATNLVEVDVETASQIISKSSSSAFSTTDSSNKVLPIASAREIHSSILRDRPWACSLFHLHPTYATIICCQENPEYAIIHRDLAMFHDEIAFESGGGLGGTGFGGFHGDDLSKCLGQKSILFHRSYGVSVLGLTLGQSLLHSYYLEWGAKLITILQSTGKAVKHLDPQKISSLKQSVTADFTHCEMFFEACKRYVLQKHPQIDDFKITSSW